MQHPIQKKQATRSWGKRLFIAFVLILALPLILLFSLFGLAIINEKLRVVALCDEEDAADIVKVRVNILENTILYLPAQYAPNLSEPYPKTTKTIASKRYGENRNLYCHTKKDVPINVDSFSFLKTKFLAQKPEFKPLRGISPLIFYSNNTSKDKTIIEALRKKSPPKLLSHPKKVREGSFWWVGKKFISANPLPSGDYLTGHCGQLSQYLRLSCTVYGSILEGKTSFRANIDLPLKKKNQPVGWPYFIPPRSMDTPKNPFYTYPMENLIPLSKVIEKFYISLEKPKAAG